MNNVKRYYPEHWAEAHIHQDIMGEWDLFDEAGQLYGHYQTKEEAIVSAENYNEHILNATPFKEEAND